MKTDELREKYLAFFETKGHARRPSDVLVPTWDPSVLFTPAGMNQFKDHFLGKVKLDFTRATTCQKCLRTGDIDNVGRTAYHHTFFEMLGNFSFGDYFKRDAIHWAWEFLTRPEWLGLDPHRLSISVYVDDDEAADIWTDQIGVPPERIERMEEDENFWPVSAPSQGPDGVCGPCSEIFFHPDHGKPVEIWNLVFTQFNRVGDPPDNLRPLPSKNIDTGMGLERTAAILQGVPSNFDIDILRPLVEAAAEACCISYQPDSDNGRRVRRVADHVRACTFAVHENVYPGPNKEKYVIRRLLRRAVLDGHQTGVRDPFLHQLVPVVAEIMRGSYPELKDTVTRVSEVIRSEEENFFGTIDDGLARIEKIFDGMEKQGRVVIDGAEAADLYQTYGVPPDLFATLAAERNWTFDWDGFAGAMKQHGAVSGKQQFELFKTGPVEALKDAIRQTEFLGYQTTESTAIVKGLVADGQPCDRVASEQQAESMIVVLDRSPFYGESGGQVGDMGELVGDGFRYVVRDTQKDSDLILHYGQLVEGELVAGAWVTARVDEVRRGAIRRAHSATHILHYALQKNLGSHAQQQGSKVDDDWLRFDFTNMSPVGDQQLAAIEHDVLERIEAGDSIQWRIVPLAEARQAGAMMLFGEKYPDPVRMVQMGDFSRELCGGTHLDNTREVEWLEITSEENVSAGTRRIVAMTGPRAIEHRQRTESALQSAAEKLQVSPLHVPVELEELTTRVRELKKQLASGIKPSAQQDASAVPDTPGQTDYAQIKIALHLAARTLNVAPFDVPKRAAALVNEIRTLEGELAQRETAAPMSADMLLDGAEVVSGTHVVVAETPGADPNFMRQMIDQLRKKSSPVAVMLAAQQGSDKVVLVAGVSRELVEQGISAGGWVREIAPVVGGGGGGKPDLAQAGGKQPEKLPEALETARDTIRQMLDNQ